MMVNKDSVSNKDQKPHGIGGLMNELHVQLNYVDNLDLPEEEKKHRKIEIMDNFISRHNLRFRFLLIDLLVIITKFAMIFTYCLLYSVIVYFIIDFFIEVKVPINWIPKMALFAFGGVYIFTRLLSILKCAIGHYVLDDPMLEEEDLEEKQEDSR